MKLPKKVRAVRMSDEDFEFIKKNFGGLTKFMDFMILNARILKQISGVGGKKTARGGKNESKTRV